MVRTNAAPNFDDTVERSRVPDYTGRTDSGRVCLQAGVTLTVGELVMRRLTVWLMLEDSGPLALATREVLNVTLEVGLELGWRETMDCGALGTLRN